MRTCVLIFVLFLLAIAVPRHTRAVWIDGYYPGWTQDRLKPSDIDYSALTHVIHFSVVPRANGTLDTDINGIGSNVTQTVNAVHTAGKKIILSIGGANSSGNFSLALDSATKQTFLNNLISFAKTNGYDGIDIDWEPLPVSQKELFGSFITDLKAAMNAQMQGSILLVTTMIGDMDQVIPSMAAIDQYNIQTYIMSGPWDGWVTWHASPLYSGTYTFPSNGAPLPSIERSVNALVSKGVPKAKIGVGSKWSGAKWTGVNAPLQSWTTPPAWQDDIPFYSLMDANYPAANNKWDDVAKVPYISIDGSGTTQDQFISYENEQSLTEKINYIKSSGIGGMIIWELNSGYRANLPAGQRNPLLSAIKTAVGGGTVISPTGTNSCSTKLGDANGDNEITLADYAVWRKAFIGKQ